MCDAREVALRIMDGRFQPSAAAAGAAGEESSLALADFQEEGADRVRAVLQRRHGAVLADSVGLGKTYVALALIEETLARGGDAVVVVPAALRGLWRRALRRLPEAGRGWRLISHTQLARGCQVRPVPSRGVGCPHDGGGRLLVVDEAHRFRNARTLRYAALARLITPETRVLLVTATPINNHAADLLHLVRLFAADDAFRDVGVASLRDAFGADPGSNRIAAVVRAVVVRRTRALVRERFGDSGRAGAAGLPRFPGRAAPHVVRYVDPRLPALAAGLGELELAPYALPGSADAASAGAGLVRIGLLKRLDSSPAAFAASLHRLARLLRITVDAARAGGTLAAIRGPGRSRPARHIDDGDPLQLSLVGLIARPAPPDLDLESLIRSLEGDLEKVRALVRLRGGPEPGTERGGPTAGPATDPAADPKLVALAALLERHQGEKTLVFTEYRDTAESLWRALSGRFRVGRADGGGAWLGRHPAGRRVVVERFAPRANGRPPPRDHERVDVLIATDVLAEGLNLQDARHVVSYDLPWNPVRLLQRIGRVDRLGSPHAEVVPHLFAPDGGLEAILGLTRRIRAKLHHISAAVGAEQADDLLERLMTDDGSSARALDDALRTAERDADDPEERLRTLWIRNRRARKPPASHPPTPHPPASHPATAPRAAIRVPHDDSAAALDWVVLLDRAGSPALLEIRRDGGIGEAGAAAVAALEIALAGSPPVSADPLPLHDIARYAHRAAASARTPAWLARHDAASRLTRRLRGAMARAGAGIHPGVITRADALLARIAAPLDPVAQTRVGALLERTTDTPLIDLMDAAEAALGDAGRGASQHPEEPGHSAVLAALQIRLVTPPGSG